MIRINDLTKSRYQEHVGKKYSFLTITGVNRNKRDYIVFMTKCECGKLGESYPSDILSMRIKSCGCYNKKLCSQRNKIIKRKYPVGKEDLSHIWLGILARCNNPRNKAYNLYGGRGITVCDRWNNFYNFYSDMGDRPSKKHSIERIDNNKGYSADNCKWATMTEQARNRRNTLRFKFGDCEMKLVEWANFLNLSYNQAIGSFRYGNLCEKIRSILETPNFIPNLEVGIKSVKKQDLLARFCKEGRE